MPRGWRWAFDELIGFIRGNPNQSSSMERYRGFVAAIEEAGMQLGDVAVEQGYFTFRSGIIATERLLDRADPPTAIFATHDDMAAAAVSVFRLKWKPATST